jgi:hypothetical protein
MALFTSVGIAGLGFLGPSVTAQAPRPIIKELGLSPLQQTQLDSTVKNLQQRSIQYFIDYRDPTSGLVRDRGFAVPSDTPHPKARMASIAATGYGLSAWVLGASSGQIPLKEARAWTQQALDFVEKHTRPEQRGWLAHFIDTETGEPYKGSEISSVDTALFYLGALTAGQFFGGDIQKQVQRMFDTVDFPFMLTQNGKLPDSLSFSHGFFLDPANIPDKPDAVSVRFIPHRWDHFSEGIILPIMAMGSTTHPVSTDVWDKGWARAPQWIQGKHSTLGPLPLFTHYYPLGYFNLKNQQDKTGFNPWALANQAILAQIDYCSKNGYPDGLFGLSACDGPTGYQAYQPEYKANQEKTIALPALAAALPWEPKAVWKGLEIAKLKGWVDSRYGLRCAVEATTGWQSPDALGIDVGSTLLMLDAAQNQRIYHLTEQHPVIQRGLKQAGFSSQPK